MSKEANSRTRFRIEGDGSPLGTRVFDAETGKEISDCVRGITLSHDANRMPELELKLTSFQFCVTANLKSPDPAATASQLRGLAASVEAGEIVIDLFQYERDLKDVTPVAARWKEFVGADRGLLIRYRTGETETGKGDEQ